MRHKKNFNHLGRKRGHRKAMLSNMAASLIMHKRIKTTTAKAKALKTLIEPLITRAKNDTTHSRRVAFSYLQDKEAVTELFREIAEKVGDRPGGYTRIIRLGARLGDNADMCIIELVDYNENMLAEKAAASKSSRRRRGAKKKSDVEASTVDTDAVVDTEAVADTEAPAEEAVAEVVEEAPAVEEAKEEVKAEVVEEEKIEEAPVEEPKAEVVEEEVKEEPKAEAEKSEEKPAEEESDEKKAE